MLHLNSCKCLGAPPDDHHRLNHFHGCVTRHEVTLKQPDCSLPCKKPITCHSRLSFSASYGGRSEIVLGKIPKSFKKSSISVRINDGFESSSPDEDNIWLRFKTDLVKNLRSFYQFCRPHTLLGTIVGITSISLLTVETISDLSLTFFIGLVKALVPSVLMNIYVVGLNQLFDVEIDKINKPFLPIASGDLSMTTGIAIVSISLLISLAMGITFQSPPLLAALVISFLLGSAYSIDLPLFRWKKQAFLAASCIMIVRAIVIQLAFFVHMQKFVLAKPLVITRSLVFATAFMCFFSAVIALFKDIPDVDGDRDFGIKSLSVSLGQERVFWLCINMLLMAYGAAVLVGAASLFIGSKLVTISGHCIMAWNLWVRAQAVDLSNKTSITSFYMFIWKLFCAEYFLIPFLR